MQVHYGWRMVKSETHQDTETLVWKSKTETPYEENRAQDFILQKSEPVSKI